VKSPVRSRIGAAVGAILLSQALSLTAPAAAMAGPPGSGEGVQYYWLDCQPGTASTGTIYEIAANHGSVMMKYSVVPCTTPNPATTAMAIGFYHPDGHAEGFAHPYAPNEFKMATVPVGAHATCLLASEADRLDCYELAWANGQAIVTQRISPADPRVAVVVPTIQRFLYFQDEGDPECPMCL